MTTSKKKSSKKSPTGTKCTKERLTDIIKACAEAGVGHIKFGDVEVTFSGFVRPQEMMYSDQVDDVSEMEPDPNFKHQVDYERNQFDTEQLILTDPLEYEERLAQDDQLEDSRTMKDHDE